MQAILIVIDLALKIYLWIVIANAVFSWLYAFGVVNPRSPAVSGIRDFLDQVTEPALRPIRRIAPNFGMVDISPVILILLIYLARLVLQMYLIPNVP
jgi:YggT family protein